MYPNPTYTYICAFYCPPPPPQCYLIPAVCLLWTIKLVCVPYAYGMHASERAFVYKTKFMIWKKKNIKGAYMQGKPCTRACAHLFLLYAQFICVCSALKPSIIMLENIVGWKKENKYWAARCVLIYIVHEMALNVHSDRMAVRIKGLRK